MTIARGLAEGRIFCDRQISQYTSIEMVFMPLIFMDEKTRKEFIDDPPGIIYEYMSEAGPRAINGMPMFTSCRMLNKGDTEKMLRIFRMLLDEEKQQNERLAAAIKNEPTTPSPDS